MYWYEEDIMQVETRNSTLSYEPETIFYGSSSIRLWESLYVDFKELKPVNLGFGGSTLAACVWYFDRIIKPYHPKRLIIYAGDNDLGDGRHPEEVFIFFRELLTRIKEQFGDLTCYFISLKPSPSRWHLAGQYIYTNKLIKEEISRQEGNWEFVDLFEHMLRPDGLPEPEYFLPDGLHLSEKGYGLWTRILTHCISGIT